MYRLFFKKGLFWCYSQLGMEENTPEYSPEEPVKAEAL